MSPMLAVATRRFNRADAAERAASLLGSSLDEVRLRGKDPEMVATRHLVAYVLRHGLSLSYPALGRLLDRDHTTVMHSVRRVTEEASADPRLAERLRALLAEVLGDEQ